MKLCFISDTHSLHTDLGTLRKGDILIHAGDILLGKSYEDDIRSLISFDDWIKKQPYKYKIVVAGNHDTLFQWNEQKALSILKSATYLRDKEIIVEGVKIYGSPWTPRYHGWSFGKKRGQDMRKVWNMIPDDVNILVTHCPPYDILDKDLEGKPVGCRDLRKRLFGLHDLKYHVFGHLHENKKTEQFGNVTFINASICDNNKQAKDAPVYGKYYGNNIKNSPTKSGDSK